MTRPTINWQRGLQYFNGHLFLPDGTTGAGAAQNGGLGPTWTTGAATVVTQATPGTAFDTQMKRAIYANVGAVADQELGPRQSLASEYIYWPGSGRYCGGFYMSAIFRIEAWAADTGRLFVGFTAYANGQCTTDTIQPNTTGLWHDSTMGADVLKFVTKDNSGGAPTLADVTTNALNAGILAAGATFLWEMWQYPNKNVDPGVNCKLSIYDVSADTEAVAFNRVKKVKWQEQGNTLSSTKFMAPQVQMSSGPGVGMAANDFKIGVQNVYCQVWSGEMD